MPSFKKLLKKPITATQRSLAQMFPMPKGRKPPMAPMQPPVAPPAAPPEMLPMPMPAEGEPLPKFKGEIPLPAEGAPIGGPIPELPPDSPRPADPQAVMELLGNPQQGGAQLMGGAKQAAKSAKMQQLAAMFPRKQ